MVKTSVNRETAGGNGRRDFGGGKGVLATVTRKAWKKRGRVGGVEHRHRRVGARSGTFICRYGDS